MAAAAGASLPGCGGTAVTEPLPPTRAPAPGVEIRRPAGGPVADPARPEVSFETDRDRTFARFLENNAGGMIRKAAVGIEKKGVLNVEITRAVAPEDTLTLTKSLLAGARKDFPDQPITLSLYDPQNAPILKARYRPGEGVHYQIAHAPTGAAAGGEPKPAVKPAAGNDPLTRGGVTERDQKFAVWAEEHGRPLLRYVEADLERHGRLWFGITRDVKPADVKPLAQSLLEGARKEFPRGDLVATVFDPEGERIGRAHLGSGGGVQWEH